MPAQDALRARLREATKCAHRALDHHPLLASLARDGLTPAAYARALAALHAPHAALETLLAAALAAAQLPPRRHDLAADLAELGVAPYPLSAALPAAPDAARRIGLLYVIEGSNLGGAVIARRLAETLPQAPCRFFAGSGGLPRWERFWQFAATTLPPDGADAACEAACATFDFYRRHLNACCGAVPPAPTFAEKPGTMIATHVPPID